MTLLGRFISILTLLAAQQEDSGESESNDTHGGYLTAGDGFKNLRQWADYFLGSKTRYEICVYTTQPFIVSSVSSFIVDGIMFPIRLIVTPQ